MENKIYCQWWKHPQLYIQMMNWMIFFYVKSFYIFIAMPDPKENWTPGICRKIIENETENCNIDVQIPDVNTF